MPWFSRPEWMTALRPGNLPTHSSIMPTWKVVRVLRLAKLVSIQRAIVLGSYFAHFTRIWPELGLAERLPYIRSRVEQEMSVISIPGMVVDVLELPYIFGGIHIPS